jgi:hypothetical protein
MKKGQTDAKANLLLEKIISAGMRKCAAKLSHISAGKWSVLGVSALRRGIDEILSGQGAAPGVRTVVYFEISGEHPFTAMVVFRPEDIALISRVYPGGSPKVQAVKYPPEILFPELGNVILNSFIGSLFDALSGSFLPAAPKCVRGEPQYLLEAVWMTLNPEQQHNVATVTLGLACGGAEARVEVIAIISQTLEKALVSAGKK